MKSHERGATQAGNGPGARHGRGAAGLHFLPAPLWRAHALATAPRRADRILILNLNGGMRSSAAFHASSNALYNPWGLLGGTGELRLGALLGDAIADPRVAPGGAAESPLGDDAYALGPAWQGLRLPRLAEAAASFSVLGTWNESRGDHTTSQQEETSGGDSGDAGILTRVHMALARQSGELDVPPFEIDTGGDLPFGRPSLPESELEIIRAWIADGAAR